MSFSLQKINQTQMFEKLSITNILSVQGAFTKLQSRMITVKTKKVSVTTEKMNKHIWLSKEQHDGCQSQQSDFPTWIQDPGWEQHSWGTSVLLSCQILFVWMTLSPLDRPKTRINLQRWSMNQTWGLRKLSKSGTGFRSRIFRSCVPMTIQLSANHKKTQEIL